MKQLALLIILAAPCFSDYIILENGESYVGDIITINDTIVVIETVRGTVTVPRKKISGLAKSESVVRLYKKKRKKAKTAQEHYALAQWCMKNGYPSAGDIEFAEALKMDPSLEQEKKSLKPADKEREKKRKQILRKIRLRRILNSLRYTASDERKKECIEELEQFDEEEKIELFIDQLELTSPKFRDYRSFLLDELNSAEHVSPGLFTRHLLREPDRSLRDKTIDIIQKKPRGTDVMKNVLISHLLSDSNNVMANLIAEQTLGKIRAREGVAVLVKRLVMTWGPSSRAHFATFTRHAYVKHVTPVVSEGATSFDPEIGTYTTGTVLEAKIYSVEREIIICSLRQITGQILPKPEAWITWWKDKGRDQYGIKDKTLIQVGAGR